MKFKKILVPFDGSEHASHALDLAYEMLRDGEDAKLYVMTVIMAPSITAYGTSSIMAANTPIALMDMDDYAEVINQALDDERAKIAERIADAIEEFGDRIVCDATANLYTVDGINEYAEENGIDLIIMGRRGLGALRGMLGSVSYGILRSSEIPVITMK